MQQATHDPLADRTTQPGSDAQRAATGPVVAGLYRYPIKACAGMAVQRAAIGPRGFLHDRELLVVRPDGTFLTQRELPHMALIQPDIQLGSLRLTGPGMPPLEVPILAHGGSIRDVVVWRDAVPAVDQRAEAAEWLSAYLGEPCRLVRMAEGHIRRVDPEYATTETDQVSFADGYPFLLTSEESLGDLNARLRERLPMNRFRPNIVVAGVGAPYDEDRWRVIQIGAVTFHAAKACARCVVTTTDQATGRRGAEPLATLATYRRSDRGVLFGQNLLHAGGGTLHVGDPVHVLARTE